MKMMMMMMMTALRLALKLTQTERERERERERESCAAAGSDAAWMSSLIRYDLIFSVLIENVNVLRDRVDVHYTQPVSRLYHSLCMTYMQLVWCSNKRTE